MTGMVGISYITFYALAAVEDTIVPEEVCGFNTEGYHEMYQDGAHEEVLVLVLKGVRVRCGYILCCAHTLYLYLLGGEVLVPDGPIRRTYLREHL